MTINEFEASLNNLEAKFVNFVAQKNKIISSITVLLTFSFLGFFFNKDLSSLKIKLLHYPNFAAAFDLIVLIIAFSIINPFLKSRSQRVGYSILVFLGLWFYQVYKLGEQANWILYLSFPLLALTGFLCLNFKTSKIRSFCVYFFSFIIVLLVVRYYSEGWAWFFKKKWNLYLFFIIAFISVNLTLSKKSLAALIFSPAHLILPLNFPIPDKENYEKDEYYIWVEGVLNVLKAFFFVILNMYLLKHFYDKTALPKFIISSYLGYILIATAVGNFVTGMSRLYYVRVIDCSNHLWLCSSPLDFYKRENVHAYVFSIRFFYFNFLKITRNTTVIVLCYFLLFPLYRSSLEILTLNHFSADQSVSNFIYYTYVFWVILFITILATYRFKFFSKSSWKAMLATHAVMLTAFSFIFSILRSN